MDTDRVDVRYIGINKPIKRDTVMGSTALWIGHNSVVAVPRSVAERLFLHPDIWIPADKKQTDLVRPAAPPASVEEPVDESEQDPGGTDAEEASPMMVSANADPISVAEVAEAISTLDRETEFSDKGRPLIASLRERFPGRPLTLDVAKAAWADFTGA